MIAAVDRLNLYLFPLFLNWIFSPNDYYIQTTNNKILHIKNKQKFFPSKLIST